MTVIEARHPIQVAIINQIIRSSEMNAIAISNVSIRQNGNLYNLNDLHKASGAENRHKPSLWLQNQQTNDLIDEIVKAGNPALDKNQHVIKVVKGGNQCGTFVCKELVYAYATWISAKFFLLVIRTFDAVISNGLPAKTTADDRTPLRQAVAALVGRKGIDYSTAYGMIHQRFNVGAIEDLPAEKLPEAVAYVHALTLHNRLCHRWTYGARGLKPHGGKLCYEVPHNPMNQHGQKSYFG